MCGNREEESGFLLGPRDACSAIGNRALSFLVRDPWKPKGELNRARFESMDENLTEKMAPWRLNVSVFVDLLMFRGADIARNSTCEEVVDQVSKR